MPTATAAPLAAGDTVVTGVSPTEAAAGAASGSAGFLALIGSLLQESAPALVASTSTSGTFAIPTPVATDDDLNDEADAASMLAALAFSQGAVTQPPRPPLPSAAPADAAPGTGVPSLDLDSAARRQATGAQASADAAPPAALLGELASGTGAAGPPSTAASRGGSNPREGLPLLSQAFDGLFAPTDGAVESLASREEGVAPRSAVTAAAGASPSPGTLLTTVSNLVNGDVAVARSASASHEAPIREHLGTPRWQEELGNRITLMAAQGQHSGSLRLNPEHLGPVEVQITVGDDRTHVQFGAQNADTRQALQDALPRLRELFASAGLQLGQAGVSHQSPRQPRSEGTSGPAIGALAGASDGEPTPLAAPVRRITHSGLLDTYA